MGYPVDYFGRPHKLCSWRVGIGSIGRTITEPLLLLLACQLLFRVALFLHELLRGMGTMHWGMRLFPI